MGVAAIAVVAMAISKQPVHLGDVMSGAPYSSPNPFSLQKGSSWRSEWQGSAVNEID